MFAPIRMMIHKDGLVTWPKCWLNISTEDRALIITNANIIEKKVILFSQFFAATVDKSVINLFLDTNHANSIPGENLVDLCFDQLPELAPVALRLLEENRGEPQRPPPNTTTSPYIKIKELVQQPENIIFEAETAPPPCTTLSLRHEFPCNNLDVNANVADLWRHYGLSPPPNNVPMSRRAGERRSRSRSRSKITHVEQPPKRFRSHRTPDGKLSERDNCSQFQWQPTSAAAESSVRYGDRAKVPDQIIIDCYEDRVYSSLSSMTPGSPLIRFVAVPTSKLDV